MQWRVEKYYPKGDGDFSTDALCITVALQIPPKLSLQQESIHQGIRGGNNHGKVLKQ